MNSLFIRIQNIIGEIKPIKLPDNTERPSSISNIPKYMGFLLILNGPPVINLEGFSSGFTVVLYSLKSLSLHQFRNIPNAIKGMPNKVKG